MPREQAGVASATVGASRQIGAILGVALMGSLTATRAHHLLGGRGGVLASVANAQQRLDPAPQWIFARATHTGYALAAASALAAAVIASISMRRLPELEPAQSSEVCNLPPPANEGARRAA